MTETRVSRRRTIVAASLLGAIAVTAIVAFWPRATDSTAVSAPDHSAHRAPAAPADTATPTSSDPEAVPVADAPESAVGAAPETSLSSAASQAAGATRDNTALTERAPIDPGAVLTGDSLGGCLAEYGENGQCLPVYPPSLASHISDMVDAGIDPAGMPHNWTCDEVRVYFADGIVVRQAGVDPQSLDGDSDGMACEPDTPPESTRNSTTSP